MLIRPAQPIATANKSQSDRRAVFVALDNESGIVDLLIPQRNERFGQLRCIYIDTSTQDSDGNGCTIQTDIGQSIVALAQTQGYYPVFVPFVSKLTISSNETVNIVLLDFDVQPATWPTSLQSSSVPNPLHVIIDDQPIATNATVQNWPASQHVTIDGQPLAVNSNVQNWLTNFPVSQNSSWVVSQGGSWTVNAAQSGAWVVSIANFPTTQAVTQSGTWNVNAVQSGTWNVGITGTATVTWSTAKPVSVSNFPATQSVSGTVAVSNFPSVYDNDAISSAMTQAQFTANDTRTIVNSTRVFLNNVIVSGVNLTNTSDGTIVFKDGSGNFVFSYTIPVTSNFTGEIIALTNMALPLIQGGNSGSLVLSATTITGGLLSVYLGSK